MKMVWAVRTRSEADTLPTSSEGIELYVTGHSAMHGRGVHGFALGDEEGVELQEREGLLRDQDVENEDRETLQKSGGVSPSGAFRSGRPDLQMIVDGVFEGGSGGGKVAVLVCGPAGMGTAMRRPVGRWVRQGREVFWHKEEFGW